MQTYTLKEGNSKEKVLMINGTMSRCPFTPPIGLPDKYTGGVNITMIPCSTMCPHAQIIDDGGLKYVTKCTGRENQFEITPEQMDINPESKIIPPPSQGNILRSL